MEGKYLPKCILQDMDKKSLEVSDLVPLKENFCGIEKFNQYIWMGVFISGSTVVYFFIQKLVVDLLKDHSKNKFAFSGWGQQSID